MCLLFSSAVPSPVVSVLNPPATPYNGTNFTLTGMMVLNHQSVDTTIATSGIWSSSGGLPETTSQNNYNLTFQPIATNNSGEYTLTVTIRPSDGSVFIVGNSGSASYNVVVRCKL